MSIPPLVALSAFCLFLWSVYEAWSRYLDGRKEREIMRLRMDVQSRLNALLDGLSHSTFQDYCSRYQAFDHLFRHSSVSYLCWNIPSSTEWIWNGTAAKSVRLTEEQFKQWQADPTTSFQVGQPYRPASTT